jgi:hypothetical protein
MLKAASAHWVSCYQSSVCENLAAKVSLNRNTPQQSEKHALFVVSELSREE